MVSLLANQREAMFKSNMCDRLKLQLQPRDVRVQCQANRRRTIHNLVRQLRERQHVAMVRDSQGGVHTGVRAMAKALREYWAGVMGGMR